jgi:predicted TIM-barrel fold metal-dependent hydrolase
MIKPMKVIDPHIHLFDLARGNYHWLDSKNPPFWPDKSKINHSFSEQDLKLGLSIELTGFVHIEAGFDNDEPWQEVTYLEQVCTKPFRSIATIDLLSSSADFTATIKKLVAYNTIIGVRHILDEQALEILNDKQALLNFNILNKYGLVFETQLPLAIPCFDHLNREHSNKESSNKKEASIKNSSVSALAKVITENSNITFIINHAGFPPTDTSPEPYQTSTSSQLSTSSQPPKPWQPPKSWVNWRTNLAVLARFPNVAIKCSGWEMTNRQYTQQWSNQCVASCIEIFSIDRVMLASNFPLCLFSHNSYQAYWHSLINSDLIKQASEQEKSALLCNNALKWYRFTEV